MVHHYRRIAKTKDGLPEQVHAAEPAAASYVATKLARLAALHKPREDALDALAKLQAEGQPRFHNSVVVVAEGF